MQRFASAGLRLDTQVATWGSLPKCSKTSLSAGSRRGLGTSHISRKIGKSSAVAYCANEALRRPRGCKRQGRKVGLRPLWACASS
jgi:hypothetical protein